MSLTKVTVRDFAIGEGCPLALMSGPCVIEGEAHCLKAAEYIKNVCSSRNINFIFKSSYDKANRSSIHSFRGPGLDEGLRILDKVKKEVDVPVVTDVHAPEQATAAADVVDILQIPAFLCRQTDLLVAAGKTGAIVSIKKGQFLAPWDMKNVIEKVQETGNDKVIAVDRGTSFGYNNLVTDLRAIPIMQGMGVPVCFDATHSVQLPGGLGNRTGGQREFIFLLAKGAVAAGVDCLFMEAHPDPDNAKSDAASQLDFKVLPSMLDKLIRLFEVVREI